MQLGDGVTLIKSCGQIDVPLYRNEHKLRYQAIVTENLHCPAIGGTTFLVDNNIKQDFQHNQVSLLGNKSTVPITHKEALMPISNLYTNHAQHNSIHSHHTQTSTEAEQPVGINRHAAAAGTADSSFGIHRHTAVNPLISRKTKRILMPGDQLTL